MELLKGCDSLTVGRIYTEESKKKMHDIFNNGNIIPGICNWFKFTVLSFVTLVTVATCIY